MENQENPKPVESPGRESVATVADLLNKFDTATIANIEDARLRNRERLHTAHAVAVHSFKVAQAAHTLSKLRLKPNQDFLYDGKRAVVCDSCDSFGNPQFKYYNQSGLVGLQAHTLYKELVDPLPF